MAIVEVRVDDRLIHGQVCGYWIPQFDVQRILIVDNEIVNDENRKVSLKFGTPPRCKLSIFDSKNMFVDEKEAAAFKKIKEHNIPMYYQITPNVSKDDISKEF